MAVPPLLGGGFGAEDALEAGGGELDADDVLAGLLGVGYVDYAAAGGEILLRLLHTRGAAGSVAGEGDADLEFGADGYVEAGDERSSVSAEIFAGSFFLEGDAAGIAAAHVERQADGDSTFRALLRHGQAGWGPGRGAPFFVC